ncbi:INO80 complex subunit 1 [Mycena kentingensis (nom. inval.)]|nr:INO80 complex subunit 1 [Mycena kentingensis (nom. inval.)]
MSSTPQSTVSANNLLGASASRSPSPTSDTGLADPTSQPSASRSQSADDTWRLITDDEESPPATPPPGIPDSQDRVVCEWNNCGQVFTDMLAIVNHLNTIHIGNHKATYVCEWASCQRRGLAQTSRFALISHIRSHTGEKPFTCALLECDKSFTRSDALAKHMRVQHNIDPPLPGRSKKRKHVEDSDSTAPLAKTKSKSKEPVPGMSTFKISKPPTRISSRIRAAAAASDGRNTPVLPMGSIEPVVNVPFVADWRRPQDPPISPVSRGMRTPPPNDLEEGELLPKLPAYLEGRLDENTSHSKAIYLIQKAKHRYAVQRHADLQDELRAARFELARAREEKETALDSLLRGYFGPRSEHLIEEIPCPPTLMPTVDTPEIASASLPPSGNPVYRRPPPIVV